MGIKKRHRGTSCLGSEWDQGVRRNKDQLVGFCRVRVLDAASASSGIEEMLEEGMLSEAEYIFTLQPHVYGTLERR